MKKNISIIILVIIILILGLFLIHKNRIPEIVITDQISNSENKSIEISLLTYEQAINCFPIVDGLYQFSKEICPQVAKAVVGEKMEAVLTGEYKGGDSYETNTYYLDFFKKGTDQKLLPTLSIFPADPKNNITILYINDNNIRVFGGGNPFKLVNGKWEEMPNEVD